MANTLKFGNGQWATGNGTALAYNDENSNFKPLPFDFTRASSGTVVNQSGLIETVGSGIPRIDFQGNTEGALLLEPSRTNLYTYSNDVSFWTKHNVTTTSDYAISPDGNQNAFRAVFSSSSNSLYINALGTTGVNNTLSVWAKSNNESSNKFRFFGNGFVTLSNDYVVTDQWQRFEFTYNCLFVTSGLTGASDSSTSDILFYGFQHEVGSYATSYIPTSGSAVTRVADTCSQTVPDGVIGQTEGTLYCEFIVNGFTNFGTPLCINNGTTNESIWLTTFGNGDIRAEVFSVNSGGIQATFTKSGNIVGTLYKIALRYANNNFAFFMNGIQVGATDLSGTVPVSMNRVDFDYTNASSFLNSSLNIINAKLYNTRLSNSELASLTQV